MTSIIMIIARLRGIKPAQKLTEMNMITERMVNSKAK